MHESHNQHLAWSFGMAAKAIDALAVPNNGLRERLLWAYSELSAVPQGGIPQTIIVELEELRSILLSAPKRKWNSETLPQANIRELHWTKRKQLAEKMVSVCIHIFEAYGANNGSSHYEH